MVHWTGADWSTRPGEAQIAMTPEDRTRLDALAADANAGNAVTEAYVVALDDAAQPARLLGLRDHWRINGPSIPLPEGAN